MKKILSKTRARLSKIRRHLFKTKSNVSIKFKNGNKTASKKYAIVFDNPIIYPRDIIIAEKENYFVLDLGIPSSHGYKNNNLLL